ncbi:MAG: family 43 glycosylhydrolase [Candidatus Latescibacteria bacterium]|nr:family 43 glycosylhydrolase [Candidatus Latescibacterota bacterium]
MSYEKQRHADIGNGHYINPIFGGDYPDPSVLRIGDDYYMTHSSFEYYPGLLIFHSKDLVNWEPVCRALYDYVGSVWAPDFIKYGDVYYIFFPADGTNYVVTAPSPEGPWSKPVDLKVGHIDPGHVVGPDSKRYLHLSNGYLAELTDDGLSVVGEPRKVYDGWQFPKDWIVECFCLESPKLTHKDGYYYLTVAEGGTAGPATSHMVVSSRSKTPWGPWEHSPYNPIVHTGNKDERWWSRGHGTLVDDTNGNWWIMYHGYEKNFYTLGRQTLMEPIEWTGDGWFKVPDNIDAAQSIRKPAGNRIVHGMKLSDDFSGDTLGIQWQFFKEYTPDRLLLKDKKLIFKSNGKTPADSFPLLCIPVNEAYEITVEAQITDTSVGGLVLYYNSEAYAGIGVSKDYFITYMRGRDYTHEKNTVSSHVFLRIVNDKHEVSTYYSVDGNTWVKSDRSFETSGYHHNTFGGFFSLRTGLFSAGEGTVTFRNFTYKGL